MITIVVPLDGSKVAEEVLPHAENLASRMHAEVLFVQVVDRRPVEAALDARGSAERVDAETVAAERYLSALAASWQSRDIDVRWQVVHGSPAASIVEFARMNRASMIAMSTHGRSGLGRLVFGSVADQVLRESGTPVYLVKPGLKLAEWGRAGR